MAKTKSKKSELKTKSIVEIRHTGEDWAASTDRVPIFDIVTPGTDGEDDTVVTYTMPAKPHSGMGLAFLAMIRRQGAELATSWLIETAVGVEGYDALAAEEDLPTEALEAIVEKIRHVSLGGLNGPK